MIFKENPEIVFKITWKWLEELDFRNPCGLTHSIKASVGLPFYTRILLWPVLTSGWVKKIQLIVIWWVFDLECNFKRKRYWNVNFIQKRKRLGIVTHVQIFLPLIPSCWFITSIFPYDFIEFQFCFSFFSSFNKIWWKMNLLTIISFSIKFS